MLYANVNKGLDMIVALPYLYWLMQCIYYRRHNSYNIQTYFLRFQVNMVRMPNYSLKKCFMNAIEEMNILSDACRSHKVTIQYDNSSTTAYIATSHDIMAITKLML